MKFRLLLLVGAAFAAIASAPLPVRVGAALGLGLWFGVDMLLEVRRQRRAGRMSNLNLTGDERTPWIDCDADYYAPFGADPVRGGLRGVCNQRKGHDGPHYASLDVEWP